MMINSFMMSMNQNAVDRQICFLSVNCCPEDQMRTLWCHIQVSNQKVTSWHPRHSRNFLHLCVKDHIDCRIPRMLLILWCHFWVLTWLWPYSIHDTSFPKKKKWKEIHLKQKEIIYKMYFLGGCRSSSATYLHINNTHFAVTWPAAGSPKDHYRTRPLLVFLWWLLSTSHKHQDCCEYGNWYLIAFPCLGWEKKTPTPTLLEAIKAVNKMGLWCIFIANDIMPW